MLYDCRTVAERDRGIAAAIEAVRSGELVVLPTDTVYGIGADAFTPCAVTALLNAKGRGRHMPPPVLVGSRHTLDGLVYSLPPAARDLVEAFWPGALTIVVEHAPSLQWDLGDTGGTVARADAAAPGRAGGAARDRPDGGLRRRTSTGQPAAITAEEAREQLGYAVRRLPGGGRVRRTRCPARSST